MQLLEGMVLEMQAYTHRFFFSTHKHDMMRQRL